MKILTDDVESDPILDFGRYSEAIINMINGPDPKFSIGIYGRWGTGKTTLMKLVENKLTEGTFSWNDIPGDEEDKAINYLYQAHDGLNWIKEKNNISIKKENRVLKIFSHDGKNTLSFNLKNKLSFSFDKQIIHRRPTAILTINGNDKRYEYQVEGREDNPKVYLKKDILTIWFNAWRFEREEQLATIALMKTIAYKMDEQPKYNRVKEILFKSVITAGKAFASKYISDKYVDEFKKNFTSKMKALAATDKDTVYFHGMKQIEDAMNKILESSPKNRIVVFIDDLDRCSPKKALEVFESIKVFLDVRGFVYVIGLSRETIDKVLSEAIRAFGVTGEEYIRKIIQIPITIQDWNESDIRILIDDILQKSKLDEEFSNIVRQNKELIASAVDLNPREVKRFINNFIVSYEIYSTDIQTFIWDEITGNDEIKFKKFLKQRFNMEWTATAKIEKIGMKEIKISADSHSLSIKIDDKRTRAIMTLDDFVLPYEYNVDSTNGKLAISPPNVKPKELLVIQALKEKWKEFYREISSNKALREGIKDYVDLEVDDRKKRFEERKNDTKKPLDFERILMNYDPASKMWDFLRDNRETIFGIEDWEIYRRATESVKEFPITKLMDIKHASAQISATIPTEIYDDSGYIVTERSRDELLQSLAKLPRDIMLQLDRWRNEEKIEKEKFNSLSKKVEKIDHYLKYQKIDDALDELGEILENLPVSVESDRLRSKVRKTLTSYKRVYDYNY